MNTLHHAEYDDTLITKISTQMKADERLHYRQPSGGGYGNPYERVPNAVAWDVKNDKVSVEGASRDYVVVIDPVTLKPDLPGTAKLRAAMGHAAGKSHGI